MKPTIYVLLIIMAASAVQAEDVGQTLADKFVGAYLLQYGRFNQLFTDEQKNTLRAAHPLLLPVASDRMYRDLFWFTVRGETRNIDWDAAAQMIRRGEIRQVSQNHDLTVVLLTFDGVMLLSKAPSISESYKVIGEVDPKHVFIIYSTE